MPAQYGLDSFGTINSLITANKAHYGLVNFWARYVTPSASGSQVTKSGAQAEWNAAYAANCKRFMPITEPRGGILTGGAPEGQADAASFCSAITTIFNNSSIYLPPSGSMEVWCFLCVEQQDQMSVAYWQGWSQYLASFQLAGAATLYPAIYMNVSGTMCSRLSGSGSYCYCIWTQEPQNSAACGSFGSTSYNGEDCSSSYNVGAAVIQQIAIDHTCNNGLGTDVNYSNPSHTVTNYMFQIAQ